MQTPTGLDQPSNVDTIVNWLRGDKPMQLAGDIVPYDFTGTGNWQTAGPAQANPNQLLEALRSGKAVVHPSSPGGAITIPPLGGPNMPRGGGGGFLMPKL